MLWVWVVNAIDPSVRNTLTFDIQYEGLGTLDQYSLRLAANSPETIRIHVEASATDMIRLEQAPQIIVDVSSIREPGEHDVSFRMAAFTPGFMPVSVSYRPLQDSNTNNTIIVRVNRVTGRTLPVGTGGISYTIERVSDEVDYFYMGREESVEPEMIHIDGPEEVLAQIAAIEVESRFRLPLSETTTQSGTLRVYNLEGERMTEEELVDVIFSRDTVNVTVTVHMVRDIPLRPTFAYGAGANEDNVRYRLNQDTVQLIGDGDVLRNMEYLELAKIRLDQVEVHGVVHRTISAPILTEIMEGQLEHVDVEIEIQDVVERPMTVAASRILFINRPEGVSAESVFATVTFYIRGPEDILSELDESDISVVVDLTSYEGRLGQLMVESFVVHVGDWPSEIVGARDQGQRIAVNLQRQS